MRYQHLYYLYYREINLLRFIFWYCNSIYNKFIILLCFICNHNKTLLISQILNKFLLWYFQTHCFAADMYIYYLPRTLIFNTHLPLKDGDLSGVGRLWWGRSGIRFKPPVFSDNSAIHYCNKTLLAIALDLNVAYSVLCLLISFREAPW